jgi:hypothetical protein
MYTVFQKTYRIVALLSLLFVAACGRRSNSNKKTDLNSIANNIAHKTMADDYPKIPGEDLLNDLGSNRLYAELQSRYTQQLMALSAETGRDKAKLILVIMSPEVGKFASNANTFGIPFILQLCSGQGIDCIDITPDLSEWTTVNDPSRAPISGNWSPAGAAMAAKMLESAITKYEDYHNPIAHDAAARPATLGDLLQLKDKEDEEDDKEGKVKPAFRMAINSQGLRMDHNVSAFKTRQRILFLGDSRILTPDLDEQHSITALLQQTFPNKEIINAGCNNYTMEDYLSLYMQKARYTDPDVVIVCTNGGDLLDEYFSQRNRYSRTNKGYKPTILEKRFYDQLVKPN